MYAIRSYYGLNQSEKEGNAPMQTIVAWLETIEREAGRLYLAAAGRFAADRPFAAFLEKLAAEEQWLV